LRDLDALDALDPAPLEDSAERWIAEPNVAVLAADPVLRRRITAVLDYDRLRVSTQGGDRAVVLADAASIGAAALVVAVQRAEDAVDLLYDARDAGFEGHVVAVVHRRRPRAVRAVLRDGIDAVVWESQTEIALPIAIRGAGAGLAVVPRAVGERLEPPPLSHREREVLALAADGASNQQIARHLTISLSTVKTHLSACFAKLGVGGRAEAFAVLADDGAAVRHDLGPGARA
jgi:DNA-binding NarL/FixJ family response regulator